MLMQAENAALILIDVQEKLSPLVSAPQQLIERCSWLMRLSRDLNVPCLISEQYPKGLGKTVSSLSELSQEAIIDKVDFSCFREPEFQAKWKQLKRKQAVLIGIETHVCVLQTALDMQASGTDVFVVVDAVSSRFELDHKYGLKRMKQAGVELVTSEMVFFEWVGQAGTPHFKTLSQTYMRGDKQ